MRGFSRAGEERVRIVSLVAEISPKLSRECPIPTQDVDQFQDSRGRAGSSEFLSRKAHFGGAHVGLRLAPCLNAQRSQEESKL